MKSDYQKFAEKYHQLTPRPTTLLEDKDVAALELFVENVLQGTGDDWVDGDDYFGVATNVK